MFLDNKKIVNNFCDGSSPSYRLSVDGKAFVFDACIFDFDGVIVDTEKYHYLAWNEAFKSVGVELSKRDYLPLKSTGKANIIAFAERQKKRAFTEREKSSIATIKDTVFAGFVDNIGRSDMLNGVEKFLSRLNKNFVKVGVGSSAKTTQSIINKLDLSFMFNVVIDGQSNFPKKPAPDIFNAVIGQLGVKSQNCLIFEDSISGIEAGLGTGGMVVAVGGIKDNRALICIDDFSVLL